MGLIIRTQETWKWKLSWKAGLWADARLLTGFAASCTPLAGPSWPASSELGCEGVGGVSRFRFLIWVLVRMGSLCENESNCALMICAVLCMHVFFQQTVLHKEHCVASVLLGGLENQAGNKVCCRTDWPSTADRTPLPDSRPPEACRPLPLAPAPPPSPRNTPLSPGKIPPHLASWS